MYRQQPLWHPPYMSFPPTYPQMTAGDIKACKQIVDSLNKDYQAQSETAYGFLLLHSTGHYPGGDEIDVPLSYADYYYLEALARKECLIQII